MSSKNQIYKDYSEEILSQITQQHIDLIKGEQGSMLAVSSDPKTFEMRRDLQPEIRTYRLKYLKRQFSDQIKLLEVKEVISK